MVITKYSENIYGLIELTRKVSRTHLQMSIISTGSVGSFQKQEDETTNKLFYCESCSC